MVHLGEDTLDHCHDTGHVRAVLHRWCNQWEGRINAWASKSGMDRIACLEALIDYWTGKYDHLPLHPNHKTETEKEILRLKRRKRKLKTQKARLRYDRRIKELQQR